MFLTIQGIQVSVLTSSPREKTSFRGRKTDSARGETRASRRGKRRSWDLSVAVQDLESAKPMKAIINGEGHFFDLADGFESSTGLKLEEVDPETSQFVFRPSGWGKFGRGLVGTMNADVGMFFVDPQLPDDCSWGITWWFNVGSGWVGEGVTSEGRFWRDGVEVSSLLSLGWTEVDGALYCDGLIGAEMALDDIFILPELPSDSMMVAWTDPATAIKLGPAPAVRVEGDLIGEARSYAYGKTSKIAIIGKMAEEASKRAGDFLTNAQQIVFSLDEVEDQYLGSLRRQIVSTPVPPDTPASWWMAHDVDGLLNISVSDGGGIDPWVDKGTNGWDLSGVGASPGPTLRLCAETGAIARGPAVAVFDGTTDQRLTSGVQTSIGRTNTLAMLVRSDVDSVRADWCDGPDATGRYVFRAESTGEWQAFESAFVSHTEPIVIGDYVLLLALFSGGLSVFRINGDDDSVDTGTAQACKGMLLGGLVTGATTLASGALAEAILWDGNAVDFDDVQAYFTEKYGSLPQT